MMLAWISDVSQRRLRTKYGCGARRRERRRTLAYIDVYKRQVLGALTYQGNSYLVLVFGRVCEWQQEE